MFKSAEAATEFAVSLLQTLAIEESSVVSELQSLVEALAKVCSTFFVSYFCLMFPIV